MGVWEWAMLKLNLADLAQYSDVIHTRRGEAVTLRFVAPGEAEQLQAYVRGLSSGSRYKRFLGAMSELPRTVLDDFIHTGRDDRYSLVANMSDGDVERIVGEARYAFHPEDDS